jgi:hypothetical protein
MDFLHVNCVREKISRLGVFVDGYHDGVLIPGKPRCESRTGEEIRTFENPFCLSSFHLPKPTRERSVRSLAIQDAGAVKHLVRRYGSSQSKHPSSSATFRKQQSTPSAVVFQQVSVAWFFGLAPQSIPSASISPELGNSARQGYAISASPQSAIGIIPDRPRRLPFNRA